MNPEYAFKACHERLQNVVVDPRPYIYKEVFYAIEDSDNNCLTVFCQCVIGIVSGCCDLLDEIISDLSANISDHLADGSQQVDTGSHRRADQLPDAFKMV